MSRYYEAYERRYQTIHSLGLQWASDCPSPIVAEVLRRYGVKQDCSLLEIGCGEGRDAFRLLEQGYHLRACDISPEAIAYCRRQRPQFADRFFRLDVCREPWEETYDFIYAVAVLHMLVEQADRDRFLGFIRDHLNPGGLGLVLSMGDGLASSASDPDHAFDTVSRVHQETGRTVQVAATSCKIVDAGTLEQELLDNGLELLEMGRTSIEPDFPVIQYAVISTPGRR